MKKLRYRVNVKEVARQVRIPITAAQRTVLHKLGFPHTETRHMNKFEAQKLISLEISSQRSARDSSNYRGWGDLDRHWDFDPDDSYLEGDLRDYGDW